MPTPDCEASGLEILNGLVRPGRIVFIDETGTSGKPLETLARDFQLFCGLELTSEAYRVARAAIVERLASIPGVQEFHASEVVNPSSDSFWYGRPVPERRALFQVLLDLVIEHSSRLFYCYVGSEQYELLQAEAQVEAHRPLRLSQKAALRKVFLDALVIRLGRNNRDRLCVTLVADADEPLHDKIKVQAFRDPEPMGGGQLIHASSRDVEGLQLADGAAFVMNRVFHCRDRKVKEKRPGPFDDVVLDAFEKLKARLVDLLKPSREGVDCAAP